MLFRSVGVVGDLDAAGLAAAADLYLCLDDDRVTGRLRDLHRLVHRDGNAAGRHCDAEPGEVLLAFGPALSNTDPQRVLNLSARGDLVEAAANLFSYLRLLDGKEAALPSRGVRRKYFAMPAMSLEEALHQLELIDHDFYLFRDAGSGELQVVYRRNHGGFGVIQAKG